jgi:hypothetical protein
LQRMRATNNPEALAKAVALLVPSEQEQKDKLQLLKDQQIYEKVEEDQKKFSWKHSGCEKFLSSNVPLADDTKQKLQSKMYEFAENFLNDNF